MKFIGSHQSSAGGVSNAIKFLPQFASTCAFFLSSPRTWKTKSLSQDDIITFTEECSTKNVQKDKILPHGNYLINLASVDDDIYNKSVTLFLTELQKCNQLGIKHYNIHPGSAKTTDKKVALEKVALSINNAHMKISDVVIVVENMAGQGGVLCKTFEEIAELISMITDKSRIGICLDTCHLYAAGFDITNVTGILSQFDKIVGLNYLTAMHLNDTTDILGSNKDRHKNLGEGLLGWETFEILMKEKVLDNMIFITETPCTGEVKIAELKTLVKFSLSGEK